MRRELIAGPTQINVVAVVKASANFRTKQLRPTLSHAALQRARRCRLAYSRQRSRVGLTPTDATAQRMMVAAIVFRHSVLGPPTHHYLYN